jgi:hypothetical protein
MQDSHLTELRHLEEKDLAFPNAQKLKSISGSHFVHKSRSVVDSGL